MSAGAEPLRYVRPMMRGAQVLMAQRALATAGFLGAEGVDGLFGPGTRRAVEALQRARGLPPTGVVDAATRDAMAAGPVAPPPTTRPTAGPVSAETLPPARVRRVILHWTGGGGRASELDLRHYHFVVERDGTVRRGVAAVDDNDSTGDGRYAAHVRGLNTGSVGLAMCGMAGAQETPFDPGPCPITEVQLEALCRLAAQICVRYGLPCGPETVLGHGEVEALLGAPQRGKWDPLRLPWRPEAGRAEVGALLRARVAALMAHGAAEEPPGQPATVRMGNRVVAGALFECAAWVRAADLPALLDVEATADREEEDRMAVRLGETVATVSRIAAPADPMDARTPDVDWVRLEDLAEQLDLGVSVEENGRALRLTGAPGGVRETAQGARLRAVTVMRGDTAWSIAQRELGAGARWGELRRRDGTGFAAVDPARLAAGMQVFLPDAAPVEAAPPPPRPAAGAMERLAERIAALSGAGEHARAATPRLVEACLARGIADPAHLAYVLATAEHETGFGRHMVEIWRDTPAQRAYEANRANERPGDGRRFLGRGYVQLTFRWNYRRFGSALGVDLEGDPDLAARPEVAAQVMAAGMGELGFRSRKWVLRAFGSGEGFEFDRARRIVNGDAAIVAARYGRAVGPAVGDRARAFVPALAEFLGAAA